MLKQYPVKSFSSLIGIDETKITKIFMTSESSGKTVYSNDKAKIKELIELLNHRYYIKSFDQRAGVGGSYSLRFYIGDDIIFSSTIIGDGIVGVGKGDDKKYPTGIHYLTSKKISDDSLDKWYKSLPVF